MASAQNIANFQGRGRNLVLVTGYLYKCGDELNQLLREREIHAGENPALDAEYSIVMFDKGEKVDAVSGTSGQRNIYIRHDNEKNIALIEPTQNVWKPTAEELQEYPHARETVKSDIYLFEDGKFMTVADDYVKLEAWLVDKQTALDISIRSIRADLEKYLMNNGGHVFNHTHLHTTRLTR